MLSTGFVCSTKLGNTETHHQDHLVKRVKERMLEQITKFMQQKLMLHSSQEQLKQSFFHVSKPVYCQNVDYITLKSTPRYDTTSALLHIVSTHETVKMTCWLASLIVRANARVIDWFNKVTRLRMSCTQGARFTLQLFINQV